MTDDRPVIALAAPGGHDLSPYVPALRAAGADPIALEPEEPLPAAVAGLCVAGNGPFGLGGEPVPPALKNAIDADRPVLGIEAGLHAVNLALGGRPPVPVPGHVGDGGEWDPRPLRRRIFLAPGGRVAQAIGGSGFVLASETHTHGVVAAGQAPGTLASAYALDDGVIEALELPGTNWVIAVQWRAHRFDEQPSGFDNLLHVFVHRAREG